MISFHRCVAIVTKEKDTEWVHRLMTTTMTQGVVHCTLWKRSQGLNKYKVILLLWNIT
jgi:hypothetical protein